MKQCIKCKSTFEINSINFYQRKLSKDGFEDTCKSCKKTYDKQYKTLNKENISEIHKNGFKIYTYTVNDINDINNMNRLGVDGIFCNFPERLH